MAYSILYKVLYEGKQAEEYKARKAEEERQKEENDDKRYNKRFGVYSLTSTLDWRDRQPGTSMGNISGAPNHENIENSKKLKDDEKRKLFDKYRKDWKKAHYAVAKEDNKREYRQIHNDKTGPSNPVGNAGDFAYAADAKARHDRRHAKHESFGIFESVEFI